jgi:hypothetical protein
MPLIHIYYFTRAEESEREKEITDVFFLKHYYFSSFICVNDLENF